MVPLLNCNILKYAISAWTVSEHYMSFIRTVRVVFSMPASAHPTQISHSIGLSLTGSLDLLREALSLLILDLTLGQTTNNSFPRGAQRSIIHTDLPWLQFSFIFRQAEEEKPNHVLLMQGATATIFPAVHNHIIMFILMNSNTFLISVLEA